MTTPGQRRTPAPPRQPVVAWWVLPVTLIAVVAFATVPLGLAISGVLTGHGFAWPAGPFGLGAFRAVFTAPADPGSAWRSQPRPGGPVAAWVSMVVCFIASGALAGVAEHVAAAGLGDDREALRLQLDEKGAVARAQRDFSSLKDRKARSIDAAAAATLVGPNVLTHSPVFLQHRDCCLVEGPTGSGKTARVAVQRCWDAPGFLLVTTTKRDLIEYTWRYRSALGRAEVYDPEDLIGFLGGLRWALLAGCDREEVAIRRARAWVRAAPMGEGTKDASFWEGKAAVLMQCFLFAAACEGLGLAAVRAWVSNRHATAPVEILEQRNPGWAADLRQITESKSDSTDDMYNACASLVEPLADPRLLAAVDTPVSESVDLHDLVLGGPNTIYLVSDGGSGSVAPIVAVFAAEVHHLLHHTAIRVGGRLDPPARLVLDEMNNVAPIPNMPSLMSDSGGRGVSIWAFAHNKVQNVDRWGRTGGELLTDSAPARLILPGLTGDRELAELSALCGTVDEYEPVIDPTHPPRLRTRNVMEKSDIRSMPVDHALLVVRGAAPFVVHLPTVHDSKAWRQEIAASKAEFAKLAPADTEREITYGESERRWA